MLTKLTLALIIIGLCFSSAVFAQDTFTTVVRGDNVPLLKRPDPDAKRVALLRRGDSIRVTGPAENLRGDEKQLTAESLGVTKRWFVPIEVVETGEKGWIAEVYVNPRAIVWETPIPIPTVSVTVESTSPSPTPGVTPAPTSTPLPTATPTPTPSPTPLPTRVPSPTPTPQPTTSQAAELAYLEATLEISSTVGASLERFGALFTVPRLGDTSWEQDLQAEVDVWELAYENALLLTPPSSMQEIHDEFIEGLRLLVLSGQELMPALRDLDVEGIDRATNLLEQSRVHTDRATELLEELMAERGYGPVYEASKEIRATVKLHPEWERLW